MQLQTQNLINNQSHTRLLVSNPGLKTRGFSKQTEAVLTRLSLNLLRYWGHNTGECDASFTLCCLQLNSFKVTETVLQAQKAFITLAKRTLREIEGTQQCLSNQITFLY